MASTMTSRPTWSHFPLSSVQSTFSASPPTRIASAHRPGLASPPSATCVTSTNSPLSSTSTLTVFAGGMTAPQNSLSMIPMLVRRGAEV